MTLESSHSFFAKHRLLIISTVLLMILAAVMRMVQGWDHFIWDFDQARDSFEVQKIIENKDVILVGPQAEIYGMFHGPLTYYILSPAYVLTDGSSWLALLLMIAINISTMPILAVLTQQLFQKRAITLFALFIFAIGYEQIGYARWISNVSVAIPFLCLTYLGMWQFFKQKVTPWWMSIILGVSLGLAVQAQLFLLYLIPIILLIFYFTRQRFFHAVNFLLAGTLTVSPMVLFEIKYGFQGAKIFFEQFLAQKDRVQMLAGEVLIQYLNHLGITAKHQLSGFSDALGLVLLSALLGFVLITWQKYSVKERRSLYFVLLLLFSHSVVFVFHFVDAIFLNLGISLAMILLASFVVHRIWQSQYKQFLMCFVMLFVFLQLAQLVKYTSNNTPFGAYKFAQTGVMFSQKLEIANEMYKLADGQKFSFAVFGNPYGVRTTWSSVLREHAKRTNSSLPAWFGYHANGFPGESYLIPQDFPEQKHILLIEPTPELHSQFVMQEYFVEVDSKTRLVEEKELYGYKIQLREPIL